MEVTRWSENQPRFAGEGFSSDIIPGYFTPEERELMGRPDWTRDQHAPPGMIDAMFDRSAWYDRNMSQSDYDQIRAERRSGVFGTARAAGPYSGRAPDKSYFGSPKYMELEERQKEDPRAWGFHPRGKGLEWAGDPREFGFHPSGKGMEWRGNMPF